MRQWEGAIGKWQVRVHVHDDGEPCVTWRRPGEAWAEPMPGGMFERWVLGKLMGQLLAGRENEAVQPDPRVDYTMGRRPSVRGGECSYCLHAPPVHEPTCATLAQPQEALDPDHLRDEGSPAPRHATPLRGGCSTCGRSLDAHAADGACPPGGKVRVQDAASRQVMWVERDARTIEVPASFTGFEGRSVVPQYSEQDGGILAGWEPVEGMVTCGWFRARVVSERKAGTRCFVERATVDAEGRQLWHLVTIEEVP